MKKYLEDRGIYITFPQLALRVLLDLGGFLLTLLPAALTLYLTDVWISSGILIPLSWMLGIIICVFIIHFYRFYFVNYNSQMNADQMVGNYRQHLARKILSSSIPAYESQNKARIQYMANDVSAVYTMSSYLVTMPSNIVKVLLIIVLLFSLATPAIALTAIIMIPLYMVPNFLNRSRLENLVAKERAAGDSWFQEFDVILNGKVSITLNKVGDYLQKRHDKALKTYTDARNRQHFFLLIVQEFPLFVTTLAPLLILTIGGNQVVLQNMTIGQLLFSIQIIGYLFNPLSEVSMLHAQIVSQKPTFDRVADFFALPDQKAEAETATSTKIEAHNIDLMRSEKEVLFHVPEFTVQDRGIVLIHGENGCGKSSLFNIISGVFPRDNHHFRVHESGSFACEKSKLNYLFYPNFLFTGTVHENIVCGRTISDAQYQELNVVLQLPPADKQVTIKPENLSLGEKQKIYLARTLLSDVSCILLDEPGSNLDEKTEHALIDYLVNLREQKLILIISHNAYYDTVADKIYEIRNHRMSQI
jgi:ABC-type bacteriocin/lantibiotic exporter with double-glycine peptidase domain